MRLALFLALALQTAPADDKAADDAIEAFKTAYKSSSEADRAALVEELAKVIHPKTLAGLGSILATDGPTVRIAAAKGLGTFTDHAKAASAALAAAFPGNGREEAVQVALLQAIGKLGDPGSLPFLHKTFDEKDPAVAKAAIQSAAEMKHSSSIDPLIALLEKLEKAAKATGAGSVTYTAPSGGPIVTAGVDALAKKRVEELLPATLKALQDLTQQKLTNSADFKAWWNRNKATFKPATK